MPGRIVKKDNCDIWMKPGYVVNHRKKLKKNVMDAVKVGFRDDDRNVGMKSRNVLPIRNGWEDDRLKLRSEGKKGKNESC